MSYSTAAATDAEYLGPRILEASAHEEQIWHHRKRDDPERAHNMTSINFAAAQQRVEERRRQRAAEYRSQLESRRSAHSSNVLSRLPPNLQGIGQYGLAAWDVIKGREGTRPAFRVGQVDAELLDEELLELLKGQVGEGLKYFGVRLSALWELTTLTDVP